MKHVYVNILPIYTVAMTSMNNINLVTDICRLCLAVITAKTKTKTTQQRMLIHHWQLNSRK